jgi:hypothetical protein
MPSWSVLEHSGVRQHKGISKCASLTKGWNPYYNIYLQLPIGLLAATLVWPIDLATRRLIGRMSLPPFFQAGIAATIAAASPPG